MPIYEYKGQQYELPDGLSNEEAKAKIQTHLGELETTQPSVEEAPKEQPKRSIAEDLARQVGLTVRGGVAGVLSPLTIASDALVSLYNKGTGSNVAPTSSSVQELMTQFGLPVPENKTEQYVQTGVEAMAGQAGLTKAAQAFYNPTLAKVVPKGGSTVIADPLLKNVTGQVASAGASGVVSPATADYVEKVTGSPVAGFVASMAAGSLAGKYAGKGVEGAIGSRTKTPTIEDIRDRASRAYAVVDDMDVKAKPLSVQNMINKAEQSLLDANFNPQMDTHRPVAQLLSQFREMTGGQRVPFTKLEQMRSAAVSLGRESREPSTRRLAGVVVGEIDDFLGGLDRKDLMPGSQRGADAVKKVMEARKDWKVQARAQIIEDILDTTALKAEIPKASEADLIRQNLVNLATNKNKMRQFSNEEQAAIKSAVKSTGADLLLNLFARFNPERAGGLGANAVMGSLGTIAVNPAVGAATGLGLGATGFGADKLQGYLKRKGAEQLRSNILTGKLDQPTDYRIPGLFGAAISGQ